MIMNGKENLCCGNTQDINKEKVTDLELVFRMIGERPYYEIKYKKVGENFYHIGYSSYDVETVLMYKEKYFEIVDGKPTNADRIRSMTDEELADILFYSCVEHIGTDRCRSAIRDFTFRENCKKCVLEWLRSESKVK